MNKLTLLAAIAIMGAAPPKGCAGHAQLLAHIPAPALPEGVVYDRGRVYVSGPAAFGRAGQGPSQLWGFSPTTGELQWSYAVSGETLAQEHANSCVAVDARGRLYVLNTQLGVLRIDPATRSQEVYSPLVPHLPTTPPYLPQLTNDLAFDAEGALYITDSLQGAIFRVPPGGGAASVWFQDARLQTPFGPNGLRVDASNHWVYFDLTTAVDGKTGYVYRLPKVASPVAAELQTLHTYSNGEGPDGIAFGDSGRLYVMLAYASQISVLDRQGNEETRYAGPIHDGSSSLPIDGPANMFIAGPGVAFVTNHASTSLVTANMVVFGLGVEEVGGPLFKP